MADSGGRPFYAQDRPGLGDNSEPQGAAREGCRGFGHHCDGYVLNEKQRRTFRDGLRDVNHSYKNPGRIRGPIARQTLEFRHE